jgi:hypothetical protein
VKSRFNGLIILLLIIGGGFIGYGLFVILSYQEIEPITVTEYNISEFPEWRDIPRNYTESDFVPNQGSRSEIIQDLRLNFRTMDVFAVNNPIHVSVNLKVKDPQLTNYIGKVILLLISPKQDFTDLGDANIEDFLIKYEKQYAILIKNSTDTYGVDYKIKFYNTQDVKWLLVILDNNNKVLNRVISEDLISISPYGDYLQTEISRLNIKQIKQANVIVEKQNKTNSILEGLELIIVGWIPLEFAFDELRNNRSENNNMHRKWHMPFYD